MAKLFVTKECQIFGHPEFRLTVTDDHVPDVDIQWLQHYLTTAVAQGESFLPGQIVRVGWLPNQVRRATDGFLTLEEPDLHTLPLRWIKSVTATLTSLRLQKDICESLFDTADLHIPYFDDWTIICNRLDKNSPFVMSRAQIKTGDSGWFLGCALEHNHEDVHNLARLSLYEVIVQYAPGALGYLGLPEGCFAYISSEIPIIDRGGDPLAFKAGSFLHRRYTDPVR